MKKLLKLFIIPLVITAIYLAAQAFLLLNHFGVFSIVEDVPVGFKKTNQQDIHLLKNQKATAALKASEDNLGIILVRLVKFGQGSDSIVFRIKKEGEEKWHHESKFSGDQVKNDQYFPLGFPPIKNSKNNIYVFEIESQEGKYKNGVGIIKGKQAAAMYKYAVGDLKNYRTLLYFTYKKSVYTLKNIQYWQDIAIFITTSLFVLFIGKRKAAATKTVKFFLDVKTNFKQFIKMIIKLETYIFFLNTNLKKRIAIGVLIFLLALTYRFAASLVNLDKLFYAELGGGGDYDQFIRAATCALNFCSWIIHQNLLIESSILGIFYEIFGFTGGLKAYLYLMLITSSTVVTLPYLLLSRKSLISIGGIIGSLFLAGSDFLTNMALSFPPDNGSLFTFSMFFVAYFLTIHIGTIRWLLFFGLMGLVDGLNKALFLINDLAAFVLFIPVFFYEKARRINKFPFVKLNSKLIFLSLLPLLVFLVIYSAWEYFVQIKFSAPYFLRGLVQSGGASYVSYTSFSDSSLAGNIVSQLFYLLVSAIVMLKRLIEYTNLRIIFLAPIFLGLLFFSFIRARFSMGKLILTLAFSVFVVVLLILIKDNYFKIHDIFPGEYILYNWKTQTYVRIYLFFAIIFLFILNFKYSALKLSLPIIFYVVMLIILAENSPFPRISTHVVAWSIILLAFLIDFLIMNINKPFDYSSTTLTAGAQGKYWIARIRIILAPLILILFTYVYIFPKMVTMVTQLYSGIALSESQVRYLSWVNSELPENAVILAGGKSDLVSLGENIKRPIVYSTLWSTALLIKPNEIPGVSPTDFTLISELQNKDNFKKNKYIILENDIFIWRNRVAGVVDGVFTKDSNITSALHGDDYSIKVYKFNPTLKKAIYELSILETLGN